MVNFFKRKLLSPILDMLYPQYCACCGVSLSDTETVLCFACEMQLPFTHYYKAAENEADIKFYGTVDIVKVAPLLYFIEDSMVQELIHKLKYKKRRDVGIYLGEQIANQYKSQHWFDAIDIIVPVPLHPKKEYKRGFNQSACIAQGIYNKSGKPVITNAITRTINTASQTRKNQQERQQNMVNAFAVMNKKSLENKNILLIDDVLTTGATLTSCAKTILSIPDTKISIITAAIASH